MFAGGVTLGAQSSAPAQPAAPAKPVAQAKAKAAKPATKKPASTATDAAASGTTSSLNARNEKQLTDLTHELNAHDTPANEQKLAQFATAHAKDEYGERAALMLGHYELDKSRPQQAVTYLNAALKQPFTLSEYALYWHAQALRQTGRNDLALGDLDTFRKQYPESIMADLALQSFAEAAITQGDSARAEAALNAYPKTAQKPALLLLRAQAREKQAKFEPAAKDYLEIYYGFPLAEETSVAGLRIAALSRQLGDNFPNTPLAQQTARAEALFTSHRWHDAQAAFDEIEGETQGAEYEHAALRIAECKAASLSGPNAYTNLSFSDPDAEAERLYSLSQEFRSQKREQEMLDTVKQIEQRFPQNHWTEEADFATGNYYWSTIDRTNAVNYYRKVATNFPDEKNGPLAAWRALWMDYVQRKDGATFELEAYVAKNPGAPNLTDALYFLGRAYERTGNAERARSFYTKDVQRFPQTYFGMRSAERLKALGQGDAATTELLGTIPDAPQLSDLAAAVPSAAEERWERAMALRSIAFDASAELELRTAYAQTQAPRLMLEAALSAIDAEHYASGISLARIAYPQPEARQATTVPANVARALYPLPYEPLVERASKHNQVDPMLVAGIMRQESAFASDAVSTAGAVGLMQIEPKTAPKLAHRQKLRYSRARLFDPEYNLTLGTLYVNDLLKQFGTPEAALAAYNAGEDRVEAWQAERKYDDVAEFVESIPFTQTRDYVQIVIRNADMYRWFQANAINTVPLTSHHAADAAAMKPAQSQPKKVIASRSGE